MAAAEMLIPLDGWWQVAHARPFVPNDWKKGLVLTGTLPLVLVVCKMPVGSTSNSETGETAGFAAAVVLAAKGADSAWRWAGGNHSGAFGGFVCPSIPAVAVTMLNTRATEGTQLRKRDTDFFKTLLQNTQNKASRKFSVQLRQ